MASNSLVPADNGDGWDDLPDSTNDSLIRGAIIKYNGVDEFFIDKASLPPATEFVVMGVQALWLRWQDRQVAERRIARPGEPYPERDELGHLDKSQWPAGFNGQENDPWKDNRYVYLLNVRSAASATFVTDTIGGRRAVGDLKNSIANMRWRQPGAVPIVKLLPVPWKTGFGMKLRPGFEILDWRMPTAPAASPKPALVAARGDEAPFDDGAPPATDYPDDDPWK